MGNPKGASKQQKAKSQVAQMTCARCGHRPDVEGKDCNSDASAKLHCRDRQLANLHSLLRSVTRRLEFASEFLSEHHYDPLETAKARTEIDAVLEILS